MVETFQPPPPPNPQPAVRFSRPTATGETVYVACKVPSGLILRVFAWETFKEPHRDGTVHDALRSVPIYGQQFILRGCWVATAGQAYNVGNGAVAELLPGGYAITEGCPKELWEKWHEQNRRSRLVENNIVLAHKDRHTLIEMVKERSGVLSGLEPLDRANPGARMGGVDRRLRLSVLEQNEITR